MKNLIFLMFYKKLPDSNIFTNSTAIPVFSKMKAHTSDDIVSQDD